MKFFEFRFLKKKKKTGIQDDAGLFVFRVLNFTYKARSEDYWVTFQKKKTITYIKQISGYQALTPKLYSLSGPSESAVQDIKCKYN